MPLESRYPFDPDAASTPGSGVFGLLTTPEESRVILVPAPFDATTSYRRGTAGGPAAILEASRQVDVFDLMAGRIYELGVAMLDEDPEIATWNEEARAFADPVIEAGGVFPDRPDLILAADAVNLRSQWMNARVRELVDGWLEQGRLVGLVGGDHSTPFGAIQAHAARFPGLGVLHLDAHADLRVAYEGFTWSHASIMHNVLQHIPGVSRLVQVGLRDLCEQEWRQIQSDERIVAFVDPWLQAQRHAGRPWAELARQVVDQLPQQVYVSFDIDALDPTLCPHTGTPVPGGLSFGEAVSLLEGVVASGRRIVGFDLNEVAPGPEGDEWDANVGARMLYRMIGLALRSQGDLSALEHGPRLRL